MTRTEDDYSDSDLTHRNLRTMILGAAATFGYRRMTELLSTHGALTLGDLQLRRVRAFHEELRALLASKEEVINATDAYIRTAGYNNCTYGEVARAAFHAGYLQGKQA